MAMRAKFKGDSETAYLNGIPARDLDEEDYEALDADQRKAVRESGLYDYKTEAEMRPASRNQETTNSAQN